MALNATPFLNLVDSDNDIQIRTDNILLLNENYFKKDDDILVVKGNTMAGIPKDSLSVLNNEDKFTGYEFISVDKTNKITTLKINNDNNNKYLKAVSEGENIKATWADVEATSIGTLSTLTVEDININNNIISSLNNKDLRLVPYTDKEISLEGDIKIIYNNELRFYNEDKTKYIGFKAPSSIESNKIWILPNSDGSSDEVLKTDGSGNLTWGKVSGGGGGGSMTSFILEDDGGTEVTIDDGKEIKFIGSGITTNWTDTSNGTDADPLTFTVNAAQTGITSIMATDLKIGEDNETKIDFETENEIHFYANNQQQVNITDGAIIPQTTNDISLGSSSNKFKEAYVEGKIIYGHHEFTDTDTNITLSKNIAYFNISGKDTLTIIDVSINVGTEGQLSHIFFDTAGTKVKLDFTEHNLYVGTGPAQYLTFSSSGQSATIVYIGSKWRVINTGATTSTSTSTS